MDEKIFNFQTFPTKNASMEEEVSRIVRRSRNIQNGVSTFIPINKTPVAEKDVKESVDILYCIINEPSKSTDTVFIDG